MKRIKYLSGSVHSSLRSSVFLFDLARVVEELILNSLDAGATKVHVNVNVGACYVKVEDNGFGVTRDGLVLLGEKYATSKLQNLANKDDDLESLSSRGEALSSLSDISLLEIITKAHGRPNAYRKVMKGQKCLFLGIDEDRQGVGTTVIVRDLFYNQPVRRKSMQSSSKKVLHSVKKCLVRAALVHPEVSFNLFDLERENELLCTLPSSSLLPLVSNNFGSEVSDCLHNVYYSDKELALSGYLSGPADTCSVKAFQYLYINSRFVCRCPVHKLINNLASRFCLSLNCQKSGSEFHDGKRQRAQGCPTYILNLHCPLSIYDLTFESSKTVVEFKDWALVLSFIERAVWHSWEQIPASSLFGESHKQKYASSIAIVGGGGTDVFSSCTSVSPEVATKENDSHSLQNFPCESSVTFSNELPAEDHNYYSCHRKSSRGLNGKTSEIKLCRTGSNCGHQIDYCSKRKAFHLQDISGFTNDEIGSPKSKTHPWVTFHKKTHPWVLEDSFSARNHLLSNHNVKVDKKDEHLLASVDERDLNKDNVPFLLRCSGGLNIPEMKHFLMENVPANTPKTSDHKVFGIEFDERESFLPYGSYVVDAYYSGESSDNPMNIQCRAKFDRFRSSFDLMRSFPDKTTSDELSTDFTQFPGYHGPYHPEGTNICPRRADRITENTFTSQLSYSDDFPGSPKSLSSSFFMSDDDLPYNIISEGNCNSFVGLTSGQFQASKFVDRFENDVENGSTKSVFTLNCKDDELCYSHEGIGYQNHSSRESKFGKVPYAQMNDETSWLNFNILISDDSNDHSKYADDLNRRCMGSTSWEDFRYCQFSPSANLRARRSHSAPPFYKHKIKYSTIYDHSKTIRTKDQGQCSDDDNTFSGSACTLKDLSQPHGTSQAYAKSMFDDPFGERLDRTLVDKKDIRNEINMVQINGSSEEDAPVMEYSDANMTKWWSGDLCPMKVQGSSRTHNFSGCEDDILDISSGLLHLASNSLVPESISRDSLEDAKVLLQVDRKFIPVVAGGILVAIDQHAADERIRLEELRQKVMLGEGHSITYLDSEHELALPEMGLQLVQNYEEQIKKWGWICSAHVQCSGSFAKNLNLLKKQSCSVNLLAVPCILGINLTDKDLLEYLEQLADTDGTSTMPPSVLRVLNFKACRGAIMFGDPLLPSECSLIVEELKETSLCFQCAHGRPTTAPLVNMVELHKHLAKLETHAECRSERWHGLQQLRPSAERAQVRLSSAKRFHNG